MSAGGVYKRTTVYLTVEQQQWLRRLTAQARLDEIPVSGSDVVRLALDLLQRESDQQLRSQLVDHVHREAELYPGRVKRGMPTATSTILA